MVQRKKKRRLKKSVVKSTQEFIKELLICMMAILLVTRFVIRPVVVSGHSMEPTLHDGSYGITNILGRNLFGIDRFDVVIVRVEQKNTYIVKRVVALPGETVSYQDGTLYINGKALEEDFLDPEFVNREDNFMSDVHEITLGEDEYFCLGDNRPHSSDSRVYGAFSSKQIISKGVLVLFPFSYFGVETW